MTIYEIKRRTAETSPYFFDRKTLRVFGQTLKSFSVKREGNRSLIQAPSHWDGQNGFGYTVRYFNPANNRLELI